MSRVPGAQPVPVRRLTDAHRRAQVGRLDEHREPEAFDQPGADALRIGLPLPAEHDLVGHHRKAAAREGDLHHRLVHRDGRCQDARPHVGNAGQLQEPLDRAVLAKAPMQADESDVGLRACQGGDELVVARVDLNHVEPRRVERLGDLLAGVERNLALGGTTALEHDDAYVLGMNRHDETPSRP